MSPRKRRLAPRALRLPSSSADINVLARGRAREATHPVRLARRASPSETDAHHQHPPRRPSGASGHPHGRRTLAESNQGGGALDGAQTPR
eukprot:6149004-Alexandrium_andersonii.AAC.1